MKQIIGTIFIFLFLAMPVGASATGNIEDAFGKALKKNISIDTGSPLDIVKQEAKYANSDPNSTNNMENILRVAINTIFSLVGVIFVILMVLAGFRWMTADGKEEQIKKAKDALKAHLIGLAILFAAYAITYFIISVFVTSEGTLGIIK